MTRSTIASRSVSISAGDARLRPKACWEPIERRRGRRRTGGDRDCWRGHGGGVPRQHRGSSRARPRATRASSPAVVTPMPRSRTAVAGPIPQIRSTGRGWRNASSSPGGTRRSPSGLATALAILARCLVRAMPTVSGQPEALAGAAAKAGGDLPRCAGDAAPFRGRRGRLRRSRAPRRTGSCPRRGRRAHGSPPRMRPFAGGRRRACGQSRLALLPPIAVRMPYAFAS